MLPSDPAELCLAEEGKRVGAHILDLPNELLFHIFFIDDVLSSKDLYNLSLLCQRFRALTLPIFLKRNGISNPKTETSLHITDWNPKRFRDADALNALNMLPDLTSIEHFRCFFQDPDSKSFRNTFQDAFHLPYAVNRVSKFVQKLKHVDRAEIYLVWDDYFIAHEKSLAYIPVPEIKRWTNSFGYLLNLLLVRGCRTLTVQYDPTFEANFHFKPSNGMKKALSYLSRNTGKRGDEPVEFLQWVFERPLHESKIVQERIDPPILPSIAGPMQCMTTLRIHSPVLLLPPFINWTLSMLRDFPHLTTISFAYIFFPKKIWSTLLPLIAGIISDKLKELAFYRGCPNLEPLDLFQFLNSLNHLKVLSIDRSFRSRFQDFPNSSKFSLRWPGNPTFPLLPSLQRLTATVELVSYLLDVRPIVKDKMYTSLPSLTHLTVYPASRLIHPLNYLASTLAINSLLDRMHSQPRSPSIVFALDAQMEFTDFEPVTRWIDAIHTESQFRRTVLETLSDSELFQLTDGTGDGLKLSLAFTRITHLLLYQLDPALPQQSPGMLCRWMNVLFPNLQRLTLTYQLAAHPTLQILDMSNEMLDLLKNTLTTSCPKIHSLVIGKTTHCLQ